MLNEKITNTIINFLWALFLFGLWVILSLHQGTEGEWWSMFSLNPDKYGPMALELSFLKITVAIFLSFIGAYFVNAFLRKSTVISNKESD